VVPTSHWAAALDKMRPPLLPAMERSQFHAMLLYQKTMKVRGGRGGGVGVGVGGGGVGVGVGGGGGVKAQQRVLCGCSGFEVGCSEGPAVWRFKPCQKTFHCPIRRRPTSSIHPNPTPPHPTPTLFQTLDEERRTILLAHTDVADAAVAGTLQMQLDALLRRFESVNLVHNLYAIYSLQCRQWASLFVGSYPFVSRNGPLCEPRTLMSIPCMCIASTSHSPSFGVT